MPTTHLIPVSLILLLILGALHDYIDLWRTEPVLARVTMPSRGTDEALRFPPAAFDRMLVSKNLKAFPWVVGSITALPEGVDISDSYALPGADWVHVSDHYPVYADLVRSEVE
jgi:hypothetical protein